MSRKKHSVADCCSERCSLLTCPSTVYDNYSVSQLTGGERSEVANGFTMDLFVSSTC